MPQPEAVQPAPAVARDPELIIEAMTAFCGLTLDVIQERDAEIAELKEQLQFTREAAIQLELAILRDTQPFRDLIVRRH